MDGLCEQRERAYILYRIGWKRTQFNPNTISLWLNIMQSVNVLRNFFSFLSLISFYFNFLSVFAAIHTMVNAMYCACMEQLLSCYYVFAIVYMRLLCQLHL